MPPFCHQDNSHETVLCLEDQTDHGPESERPADLASFGVDLLKKNVAAVKYGLGFRYQKPKSREADNDLLWGQSQSGMIHSPLSTISICI